jgi:hypothetical protein
MSANRVYKINAPNGVVGINSAGVAVTRVIGISDTAANNAARVLDAGEIATDSDTKQFRVGDGVTAGGSYKINAAQVTTADAQIASLTVDGLSSLSGTVTFASGAAMVGDDGIAAFPEVDADDFVQRGVSLDVLLAAKANTSALSSYLTTATAASTYATITSLGSYLTTATAGTTYTPLTRTISTTAPLTGGGDLSANRTLAITAASGAAAGSMSSADFTKLAGVASGATANSSDATLLARANHTGTQSADTLTDGTTNKAFTATERTKLSGIATAATANSTDATLLARANHTGTQAASTITGSFAQVSQTQQTLTDGASIAWNMASGGNATVTLGGARALANPTNLTAGTTYTLIVKQDGTGGRTLTYGATYKWTFGTAPTLSTAINAIDVLTFYYDGTNLYGTCLRSFA